MRTPPVYLARIRKKYNELGEIWERTDLWHAWSKRQIEREMFTVARQLVTDQKPLIVDVGSGGWSYFGADHSQINIDVAEDRLRHSRWPVCASAESLPLRSKVSDLTICVGPVINYCSLQETLREFAHVTKESGHLVLHVELSNSFEFFGSDAYRADAAYVTTFYQGAEQYWVYSDSFVRRMLAAYGFTIERVRYFHILSSLIYRLTRSPNFSSYFSVADAFARHLWMVAEIADSAIFVCRRGSVE